MEGGGFSGGSTVPKKIDQRGFSVSVRGRKSNLAVAPWEDMPSHTEDNITQQLVSEYSSYMSYSLNS